MNRKLIDGPFAGQEREVTKASIREGSFLVEGFETIAPLELFRGRREGQHARYGRAKYRLDDADPSIGRFVETPNLSRPKNLTT